jgi:hypothetical protein
VGFYPVNSSAAYALAGTLYPITITSPVLYEMTIAGSGSISGVYGINGTVTAYSMSITRTAGTVPTYIGSDMYGTRYGNGKFREVLLYNRALSTTERVQVETYLRAKWATG